MVQNDTLRRKALSVIAEVKKVIVGKDDVVTKLFLGMLAKGHVLLEDIPGVGKTSLVVALSAAMSLDFKRIQFTPEVMPADVVGYTLYDRETGERSYQPGAALCNLLLVDEINRASSKTQSALLEVMEEQAVTVDGVTHRISPPYTVIATQNPAGSAGTQLLPESQLDRFMLRLTLGYPDVEDEAILLKQRRAASPLESVRPVASAQDLGAMQTEVEAVHIDDDLYRYIARISDATRATPRLRLGVSPRGSLALLRMSRAIAWLSGRDYVLPGDIRLVVPEALAHRVLTHAHTAQSETDNVAEILTDLIAAIPEPGMQVRRAVG
ncbi:MAG: MoxR family ATPase [Actinomycetia bacterium]|nr:MoxR family ATPase [Actinomycetes bacterium]